MYGTTTNGSCSGELSLDKNYVRAKLIWIDTDIDSMNESYPFIIYY